MARNCSVPGCPNKLIAKGFCESHYHRNKKYGDPLKGPLVGPDVAGSPSHYYQNSVLPFSGSECLIWPHARDKQGYGRIKIAGKMTAVHRAACEYRNGAPSSPDLEAAHSCGNGHLGCCNPLHIEWKTRLENQADKRIHGTARSGPIRKLTPQDVRAIRSLRENFTCSDLSARFGVRPATIVDILYGRTWKGVS